jgi:hypothetical protein
MADFESRKNTVIIHSTAALNYGIAFMVGCSIVMEINHCQ